MDNVIGYSSDTANVMFGEKNSVVGLLKKDCPHVVTIRCSCHMIHLCASYCMQARNCQYLWKIYVTKHTCSFQSVQSAN